jgi:hypothetical protein
VSGRPDILVDGSNVAYAETAESGAPKVANLEAMRDRLRGAGYRPIVIVDAALRHEVDQPDRLEALLNDQRVRQAPAGTDADDFVLDVAAERGAYVVSNDVFDGYREAHPWIEERRVPFMIIDGAVHLRAPEGFGEGADDG